MRRIRSRCLGATCAAAFLSGLPAVARDQTSRGHRGTSIPGMSGKESFGRTPSFRRAEGVARRRTPGHPFLQKGCGPGYPRSGRFFSPAAPRWSVALLSLSDMSGSELRGAQNRRLEPGRGIRRRITLSSPSSSKSPKVRRPQKNCRPLALRQRPAAASLGIWLRLGPRRSFARGASA